MNTLRYLILLAFPLSGIYAQAPTSNLYMFDLNRKGDTLFAFSKPRFLTHFNATGYNNHPFFATSDEVYFSSQEPGQDQPDIRRISLRDSICTKLTDTYEGEYSPRRAPFESSGYNLVRMEFTEKDTFIRLWHINNANYGAFGARPLFQDLTNVGYYEWIRPGLIALHLNGTPNILALAIPETNSITPVAQAIGRCFKMVANTNSLIYLQKSTTGTPMLMRMDMRTYNAQTRPDPKPLIAPLLNREDFTVLNDGTILMALGSKLFKYKPDLDRDWILVADFAEHQLNQITRLEVSRDNSRIILVN